MIVAMDWSLIIILVLLVSYLDLSLSAPVINLSTHSTDTTALQMGALGSGSGIMMKQPDSDMDTNTDTTTATASTSLSPAIESKDLVTRTEDVVDVSDIAEVWEMQCSKYPKTCRDPPYNFHCVQYNLEYDEFNPRCWEVCECVWSGIDGGGCRSSNEAGSTSCIGSGDLALKSENLTDSTIPVVSSSGTTADLISRSKGIMEELGLEKDEPNLGHADLIRSPSEEDLSDLAISGQTVDSAGIAEASDI